MLSTISDSNGPRDLLLARQSSSSSNENHPDGRHLALVVEGGGMRGVVAGGMVAALEERGLQPHFDSIHGSSAGACAGAYFIAGQARLGARIFYEDVNNSIFIDRYRLLRGRPIMDTSYLVDFVMKNSKPLCIDRIINSNGRLHIVLTNARTGHTFVINKFNSESQIRSILRATITMPIIGGHSVNVDGERYLDGGMTQQIPIDSALKAGATDIIVLLTRSDGKREIEDWTIERQIGRILLYFTHGRAVSRLYLGRSKSINRTLDVVYEGFVGGYKDGRYANIDFIVRSSGSTYVGRTTKDAATLIDAAEEARNAVFAYLAGR